MQVPWHNFANREGIKREILLYILRSFKPRLKTWKSVYKRLKLKGIFIKIKGINSAILSLGILLQKR